MEPERYAPPKALVRDVAPQSPGPIPDWAAVLIGLAADKFLTMIVADALSSAFASAVAVDEELETTVALVIDLGLTYAGSLGALWLTLQLCRSRSFRVVSFVAALSLLIMFAERWLLNDYGWPLWYEIALLFAAPLALASLYGRVGRAVASR